MSLAPRPPLDRTALERVLARAAELQGQASSAEPTGALTDEQILELGKEVGLTPEALRQAIAEERSHVALPAAGGLIGSWLGADAFAAARTVPGTPEAALRAIDAVVRGELPFDVKRRFADRMQWEPRRGFFETMKSQFVRGVEGVDLKLAEEVSATAIAIDASRSSVRIDATLTNARARAWQSSISYVLIVLLFSVLFVWGFQMPAVFAVPILTGLLAASLASVRRRYRRAALRVRTAIEQVLDRLEFGPAKKRGGIVDTLLG